MNNVDVFGLTVDPPPKIAAGRWQAVMERQQQGIRDAVGKRLAAQMRRQQLFGAGGGSS